MHQPPTRDSGSATSATVEQFVGRQHEMAELRAALAAAVEGHGTICMLVGEPGIGKSRTAQELAAAASREGIQLFWGRCYESPGAPPYWPWVQVVRSYIATQDAGQLRREMGAGASVIAEIVPELRGKLPDLPPADPVQDPDVARFRLFDSIAGFFRLAAQQRTLLIFLENLHAADTSSLLLLEFLARELPQLHLLIVGTYRDQELTLAHPLSETLGELARETGAGAFRRLPLRGLDHQEVSQFINGLAGVLPPEGIVRAVHTQTEGNPLFVLEIARLLVEEGVLGRPQAVGEAPLSRVLRLPEGVKQVIGRRLNRLSEGCRQVLTTGSAFGREFPQRELQYLFSDEPAAWLTEMIEEALSARIVEPGSTSRGGYQFTHSLIRETLYDELSPPRRALLNRRIGEVLEKLHAANLESHLPQLAHHFAEAARDGDGEQCIHYAQRAAEQATALASYEQAADYYQMALDVLSDRPDPTRQCQLLMALGEVQNKAGDFPASIASFTRAAEVARHAELAEEFAWSALGFERASSRTGSPGAPSARLLEAALRGLPDVPSPLRAQVLGALARATTFSGAWEEGARLAREALQMAQHTGDRHTLSEVLKGRTEVSFAPHLVRELFAVVDTTLALVRDVEDTEIEMEILSWTSIFRLLLGDKPAAIQGVDALERIAQRWQQPYYLYYAACCRITLSLLEGRFSEAEEQIERALVTARRFRGIDALSAYGLQMFTLRRAQGRLSEIEPALRAFVRQHEAATTWRPGLALLYAELGLQAEAQAEFDRLAESEFGTLPHDALWVTCLAYLSEVCAFLGDRERAAVLYRLLQPQDGYCIVLGMGVLFCGAAARFLGMLAATMDRWDDAERHFEEALALETRAGARASLPTTQHAFATMLLRRGRPDDQQRALALATEARALAESLGMQSLQHRCQLLLESVPPEHRSASQPSVVAYPDDLTEREVEVLGLIVDGLTNQQIAEALVISPYTAAHHVRNIMAKTGAPNRTAAAAYALSHGLKPQ